MSSNTFNVLLGIGGSGARCVEAYLHLAAMGIGPPAVDIGVIDQDESNGNALDAKTLMRTVAALNKAFRADGKTKLSEDKDVPFLRTTVTPIGKEGIWSPPLDDNAKRPYRFFHYESMKDRPDGALFDVLYDKRDQGMDLDKGYLGRPSMGSAILTANVLGDADYLTALINRLTAAAGAGQETRVFLVGSIFGGTGAAGFPTLARLIAKDKRVKDRRQAIKIGGALLLPYFHFEDTTAPDDDVRAKAAAFLRNAEGALRYYHSLERASAATEEKTRVFDSIYLAGLDPYLHRSNLGKGGRDQVNPPMLPELLAALAACRHFDISEVEDGGVYISGREEADKFGWSDLPSTAAEEVTESAVQSQKSLQEHIGTAVRFAYAFTHVYRAALRDDVSPAIRSEAWFRRQVSDFKVELKNEQDSLNALDDYLRRLLKWTAEITAASEVSGRFALKLFETGRYAAVDALTQKLDLKKTANVRDFSFLISGRRDRGLQAVLDQLTYEKPPSDAQGLGGILSSLYKACRLN